MPESLFRYVWRINPRGQILLIVLTGLVFPLSMVPLELQRRLVDQAIKGEDIHLLGVLGAVYLGVMLLQGGLKYLMNLRRARIIQQATSHLREAIYFCLYAVVPRRDPRQSGDPTEDQGTVVSMIAAEAEKVGQFAGIALSDPILQGGTMLAVFGYMVWVEPVVALIGLVVYAPQMIFIPLMQRRINRHNQRYTARVRQLGNFVVDEGETATTAREVPAEFRHIVDRMVGARMRALRLKYLMKFLRNFINALGPLSILVVGGWFVIQGRTEVGTIVAFLSGFERITSPWTELIAYYRQVSNARMKYRMVIEHFPTRSDPSAPVPEPRFS